METAKMDERVKAIVTKEFDVAIKQKETEIDQIEKAIKGVQEALRVVRASAVKSHYLKATSKQKSNQPEVVGMHPETRRFVGAKRPLTRPATRSRSGATTSTVVKSEPSASPSPSDTTSPTKSCTATTATTTKTAEATTTSLQNVDDAPRGAHLKSRLSLVVGNVSQSLSELASDKCTHKWMLYVRLSQTEDNNNDKKTSNNDIANYVSRVVFHIHPSFAPHSSVVVSKPPFQLTRRGWGEFPARVRVYFKNGDVNKPVEIVHQLKLDRTGAKWVTKGSETNVDVWVHVGDESQMSNGECVIQPGDKSDYDYLDRILNRDDGRGSKRKKSSRKRDDEKNKDELRLCDFELDTKDSKIGHLLVNNGIETTKNDRLNNGFQTRDKTLRPRSLKSTTPVKKTSKPNSNGDVVRSLPPGSSLLKRSSPAHLRRRKQNKRVA